MLKDKSLYKQGLNRKQALLFPPSVDDYVPEDSVARAIDIYADSLDLSALGFKDTRKSSNIDGNRAYHPSLLLKIYIYGYLNKIRSSRMLERECKRNIEIMFLTNGLYPKYHTISDFRKDNPKALKEVFKEFTLLCKDINLLETDTFALDGAFLRANASKNTLLMKTSIEKDIKKAEQKADEYLKTLEFTDKENEPPTSIKHIPNTLDKLNKRKQKLKENLDFLKKNDLNQFNKTDPDARLMKKPAHNLMAYNTQIVVDSKFKFIVATDVSSIGVDRPFLYPLAKDAKDTLKKEKMTLLADTGYYSSNGLKKCIDENVNIYVPMPKTTNQQKAKGFYTKDEFIYDEKKDCYICPNNQEVRKEKTTKIRNGRKDIVYSTLTLTCKHCPIRKNCIPDKTKYKRLYRWEFEHLAIEHKEKMKTQNAKYMIKKRASTVEHLFGTIKRTLGWDHFLVRGLEKVKGENALICFT